MTAPIQTPGLAAPAELIRAPSTAPGGGAFGEVLAEAVDRVERYREQAGSAVERFLSGEDQELHQVALAAQRAELAFELFLQMKNKVVQAYQEVMRMQL